MVETIIGLIAGLLLQYWFGEYKSRKENSRELVSKYLIFLQDASESLYHRIENVTNKSGKDIMENEYFYTTTLYSISKLLAVDLLMIRDGVYANDLLNRDKILAIKEMLNEFHNEFDKDIFFRYYRIELAEACIENNGLSGWHDFRVKIDGSEYKKALASYNNYLENSPSIQASSLKTKLVSLIDMLEEITKIPTSISHQLKN